jgi:hypothetical protein
MLNLSILGQVAPILLILGGFPLAYRVYLKLRKQLKGLMSFALAITQLILGTICLLGAFFTNPYYGGLTAMLLGLIGAVNIIIIITWGGKMPIAALIALGLGVWFGYLGGSTVKYKVVLFFELIDKNVPETYVGIALAALIAFAVYIFLRMFQDILVAVAGVFDNILISALLVSVCLLQAILVFGGSGLQPFIHELINAA